jgi:hypothetical protein
MAVYNPTTVAPYISGSPNTSLVRKTFRVQSAGAAGAAGQPDFQIPAGACTSATHASTGVYTFTLPDYLKLGTLVSAQAQVMGTVSGADTGIDPYVVSYSAGVLTVHVYSRGTDTAGTTGAPALAIIPNNDWLMLDLVFAQDVVAEGTAGALIVTP